MKALPLEMENRLDVLGNFEGSNDLMISNLAADRGAKLIEMFRIGEDSAFALRVEKGECDIGGNVSALLVLLNRPLPESWVGDRRAQHGREFASCLIHRGTLCPATEIRATEIKENYGRRPAGLPSQLSLYYASV